MPNTPNVMVEYPSAGGSSPKADWASWQRLLTTQRERLGTIESAVAMQRRALRPDEQPLTTARLEQVAESLSSNLNSVGSVLQPLNVPSATRFQRFFPAPASKDRRLSPHAAGHIDLNNLRYLLRDWSVGESAWGESEIHAMMEVLRPAFAAIGEGRKVVAAGAGAMRLPLEVARELVACHCVLIELDALLCQASAHLLNNQPMMLREIPDEPREAVAISQELSPPADWESWLKALSLTIQCGDANELVPAAIKQAGSQALLFTPFILDVAGGDILKRCEQWVAAMPLGSRWLNIGPISVREPHSRMNYGVDEVRDCLARAGLNIDYEQQSLIPHLSSPHNRRQQQYWCWVFSGVRV